MSKAQISEQVAASSRVINRLNDVVESLNRINNPLLRFVFGFVYGRYIHGFINSAKESEVVEFAKYASDDLLIFFSQKLAKEGSRNQVFSKDMESIGGNKVKKFYEKLSKVSSADVEEERYAKILKVIYDNYPHPDSRQTLLEGAIKDSDAGSNYRAVEILHRYFFNDNEGDVESFFCDKILDYPSQIIGHLQRGELDENEVLNKKELLSRVLEQKNSLGYTPLQRAIISENKAATKALLLNSEASQTCNYGGVKNASLLHLLAANPNLAELAPEFFEKQRDNLGATNEDNVNFLHVAAYFSNIIFLKSFINYCDQNQSDRVNSEQQKERKGLLKNLLNQRNSLGLKPCQQAALQGNIEFIKLICDQGITFREDYEIIYQAKTLEMASLLYKNGAPIIEQNEFAERFLKQANIIGEEAKFLKKVYSDIIIAGVACSTKDFPIPLPLYKSIFPRVIEEADFDKKGKGLILKIAKSIFEGNSLPTLDGSNIRFFNPKINRHLALFIIESDKDDAPRRLSYCDGNLSLDEASGFGEVVFEFDAQKLQALSCKTSKDVIDLLLLPQNSFAELRKGGCFDRSLFDKVTSQFVTCDEEGRPQTIAKNIPTKPQNRGNCSFKSFNIALRAAMTKIDPEMQFLRDEQGVVYGKGYEAFKEYKNSLIEQSIETLMEATKPENKDKIFYQNALYSLKESVFLWAAKKGKIVLLEDIANVLDLENIDIAEIKNGLDQNIWAYALSQQNEAVRKFCQDRKTKPNDQTVFAAKNFVELRFLIDAEIDLSVVNKDGSNFLHEATISENLKLIEDFNSYCDEADGVSKDEQNRRIKLRSNLLEQKDSLGYTPLQLAIIEDKAATKALLPNSEASQTCNYGGVENASLLHLLATKPNLAELAPEFFEKQKDNFGAVHSLGSNFLYSAAANRNFELIDKFIAYSESIEKGEELLTTLLHQKNNEGKTPFETIQSNEESPSTKMSPKLSELVFRTNHEEQNCVQAPN